MSLGRPAIIDDLKIKRIIDAVTKGNTRRNAALAARISEPCLKGWIRKGRNGEEPYASFVARLDEAEAEAEARHVANIEIAAGKGAWQASAWWLERRRRFAWRKPAAEQVVAGDKNQDLSELSLEDLEKALENAVAMKKAEAAKKKQAG